jgi:hypothetical protein
MWPSGSGVVFSGDFVPLGYGTTPCRTPFQVLASKRMSNIVQSVGGLLRDGTEEWILVHVEVQVRPDRRLPEGLCREHSRVADCHKRRVVTLAVLADTSPGFPPGAYEEKFAGATED